MSMTSVALKPLQDKQVELDTKKKILGAVMDISSIEDPNAILELYKERVKSLAVNINGEIVESDEKGNPIVAEKINIQKNHKVDPEDRIYPVFTFMSEGSSTEVDAYIFPMFGAGLWDWISGYMAIDKDLNTIRGIAFDHKQETPGLGARITEIGVQDRYIGKKLFDGSELKSVTMVKGEGKTGLSEYEVDGLSGATLTAKGVNIMLEHYIGCYTGYLNSIKSSSAIARN